MPIPTVDTPGQQDITRELEMHIHLNINASNNQEKQGTGFVMKAEGLDFERWKFPGRESTG